jgi:hypothetical protein
VFALGLVAALLGLVLLAIDGIRAGAARTLAPVPLVGLLVGIAAGDQGGAILLGVAWAAIAVSLSRRSVINPTVARA